VAVIALGPPGNAPGRRPSCQRASHGSGTRESNGRAIFEHVKSADCFPLRESTKIMQQQGSTLSTGAVTAAYRKHW
jgi:hypothetical protein